MKKALVDVAVLLVFFTRHEQFKKVFEQVREARPSELFLYQDGPRKNHVDDIENIRKCREIAESIDWECKVHRLYQEKNVGVDPSGYIADTWAFSQVDKCIVLEDDVVPSISFFSFCKKMLDKYENDERVMLISGFNVEERTEDIKTDYFFSRTTFTWGWASWSRVIRDWDPNYLFLNKASEYRKMQQYINENHLVKNMLNVFKEHRDSRVAHFETILISNQYLHEGLTIVPQKNLVNNIGIAADSAHYTSDLNCVPKGVRRIFTMQRYEIDYSKLIEPNIIEDYPKYKKNSYRIYGWGHFGVKLYRVFETSFYQIRNGNYRSVVSDLKEKMFKFLTRTNS